MKHTLKITSILATFLLTGCVSGMPDLLGSNLDKTNNKPVLFKTNQVHFMSSLKDKSNMTERNTYLDEFLLKSDMQCQNYLNSPLKKPEVDASKDSLYMSLFDGVSGLLGMSLVTSTAKAVFLNDDGESVEDKKAYANALSPEIRKGVELGRSRYARAMVQKKGHTLQTYSVNNLREDTLKYDKQCNDVYGLIEINRALKEMQNTSYAQPTTPVLKINPQAIKAKVAAATKEVEKKKIEKKKVEKAKEKAKVVPTQPKPVDVPVHRDTVQQMPRSPQL